MDNTLMTIIGIFIAAILLFAFPLMSITERNDNIAQTVVQTATAEFVDKISLSGSIKPSDYEEYIQKLSSTGNTFDVEIEVQHLDENFGKKSATTAKDLIGENERYSTFTTEILDNMYLSDGTSKNYVLKKGDNIIITAKNNNKTTAQILRTFIYKVTGQGTYEISAISSSMVVNNGIETSDIKIGSSDNIANPPNSSDKLYLYYYGNECINITGGWESTIVSDWEGTNDATYRGAFYEKRERYLNIGDEKENAFGDGSFITLAKIDEIKDYNKLHIKFEINRSYTREARENDKYEGDDRSNGLNINFTNTKQIIKYKDNNSYLYNGNTVGWEILNDEYSNNYKEKYDILQQIRVWNSGTIGIEENTGDIIEQEIDLGDSLKNGVGNEGCYIMLRAYAHTYKEHMIDVNIYEVYLSKDATNEETGNSNGNTSQEQQGIVTAENIPSTEYGKYVTNYYPENGSNVGWRIFHSDGQRIYLISDDYIDTDKVPGKNGYNVTKDMDLDDGGAQGGSWGQYEKGFGLRDALLNQYNGTIATKATEYFTDRQIWSTFKNKYAEYAIGVPTLELFVASYNKTHPNRTIEIQSSSNGYKLKWSGDAQWAESNQLTEIDEYNGLYIKELIKTGDKYNAYGMWIASQSDNTEDANGVSQYMMYVTGTKEMIDDATVTSHNGFPGATNLGSRPIIALKSDVILKKQDDGNYIIDSNKQVVNWEQDGTYIYGKTENGDIVVTLQVGDYINYDCTNGATTYSYTSPSIKNGYGDQTFQTRNNVKWRVIGVKDNQLNISAPIGEWYNLFYKEKNDVGELNNISKIFANGYGATEGRSINKDDIINLCKAFGKYDNKLDEYGRPYYNYERDGEQLFRIYLTSENDFEVDRSSNDIYFTQCNERLLDILYPTRGYDNFYKTGFWIANSFEYDNGSTFGIYGTWLDENNVETIFAYYLNYNDLWPNGRSLSVRPVVELKTNIELEYRGTYNNSNVWDIIG